MTWMSGESAQFQAQLCIDLWQAWYVKRVQRLKNLAICVENRQLYFDLERVLVIEPTLFAWEEKVLPLNYTRRKADYRSDPLPALKPGMHHIQAAKQTPIIFNV